MVAVELVPLSASPTKGRGVSLPVIFPCQIATRFPSVCLLSCCLSQNRGNGSSCLLQDKAQVFIRYSKVSKKYSGYQSVNPDKPWDNSRCIPWKFWRLNFQSSAEGASLQTFVYGFIWCTFENMKTWLWLTYLQNMHQARFYIGCHWMYSVGEPCYDIMFNQTSEEYL